MNNLKTLIIGILGLIGLWFLYSLIPYEMLPASLRFYWQESLAYNFTVISEGYLTKGETARNFKTDIDRVEISQINGANPNPDLTITELETIEDFFLALAKHEPTYNPCQPEAGDAVYLVEAFNPALKMKGEFTVHFCPGGGRPVAILTLEEPGLNVDYFENRDLYRFFYEKGFFAN